MARPRAGLRLPVTFFATGDDLLPGLLRAEHDLRLTWVRCGASTAGGPERLRSAAEIDGLGVHATGHSSTGLVLLGLPRGAEPLTRPVTQRGGAPASYVDPDQQREGVIVRPGGRFDAHTLICGEIVAAADTATVLWLADAFIQRVLGSFERVHGTFVGPQAAALLDAGGRLCTTGARAPVKYDLRR